LLPMWPCHCILIFFFVWYCPQILPVVLSGFYHIYISWSRASSVIIMTG
jgi:hypothetical protein